MLGSHTGKAEGVTGKYSSLLLPTFGGALCVVRVHSTQASCSTCGCTFTVRDFIAFSHTAALYRGRMALVLVTRRCLRNTDVRYNCPSPQALLEQEAAEDERSKASELAKEKLGLVDELQKQLVRIIDALSKGIYRNMMRSHLGAHNAEKSICHRVPARASSFIKY